MDAPKVRLLAVVVQVEAVLDDGEHLTPLPIDPVRIGAKDWEVWAITGLPASLEIIQSQVTERQAATDT